MTDSDFPRDAGGGEASPAAFGSLSAGRQYGGSALVLILLLGLARAGYVLAPTWLQHIAPFCDWLSTTPLSVALQSTLWIVPAVQTIHILLIAAVMGSVLFLDLRLLGFVGRDQTMAAAAQRFLPTIWYALPGLALTGSLLIIAEPKRELTNPSFGIKMLLLVGVILLTAWFQRCLRISPTAWNGGSGRLLAVVSLALWIGIVIAGRWIAYTQEDY